MVVLCNLVKLYPMSWHMGILIGSHSPEARPTLGAMVLVLMLMLMLVVLLLVLVLMDVLVVVVT